MNTRLSFTTLSIAIIISLTTSLFMTVNVNADETPPPPAPTEEVIVVPTQTNIPVATVEVVQLPTQTNTPTPTIAVQITSTPTNAPITPTAQVVSNLPENVESTPSETVSEILEELPENTNIIITTEHGIEPLATNTAQEAILIGDPIWCPTGIPPIPGMGGCSISYANLSTLVYNITEPTGNGTIWITSGADTSPSFISFDGTVFTTWSNYNLTIQGGWNGDSLGTINSTTSFSNPIEIVDWTGNITVNNITANAVGSTGLTIDTVGDVSLSNLTLNNNNYSGLSVLSGGEITAQNITANNNGTSGPSYGFGAEFSGTELTLNGNNEFSGNGETGMYTTTSGNITINNLTANNNGTGGVYGSGVELLSTAGSVTLTGTNQFDNNNNTGLIIEANDSINIENVSANDNGTNTSYGTGAELFSDTGTVTLTGTNQFNNNSGTGLYVESADDITAENITADNNGGSGAELTSTLQDITLTGINQFNSNYGAGLYGDAGDEVNLENITASNNGTSGSYGSGVEVFGSSLNMTGTNIFNYNSESGIFADIDGDITLENITSTYNGVNNYGVGAELISTGFVEISGFNVFSNNASGGLTIQADSNITITNTAIENNLNTGLSLSSLATIILNCSTVIGNQGYSIDAGTPLLQLEGTEISGNSNDAIISADNIFYYSNSCFTYPRREIPPPLPPRHVTTVAVSSGETVPILCGVYDALILYLPNGDGASLPCSIGDSARLVAMNTNLIPGALPRQNNFLSSFDLTISNNGTPLAPVGDKDSLWYWTVEYDENNKKIITAYQWDGAQWVNAQLSTLPFIRIFFIVPEHLKQSNLAILYWNGTEWLELSDGLNVGQGRFVTQGGRFDGIYFEAEVNFIGTFVLVEK